MRIIRRLFIALFIAVATVLLAALAGGWFFQDKIKGRFIEALNRQLLVPVSIEEDNIRFSLLRDFPDASVSFQDLRLAESIPGSDSAFLAVGRLALRFSAVDLLRGRYRVRAVVIEDGRLRARRLANGQVNYRFWKPAPDSTSKQLDLAVENLLLRRINASYEDAGSKQHYAIRVEKGSASGEWSGKDAAVLLDLSGQPAALAWQGRPIPFQEAFRLRGALQTRSPDQGLRLEQGSLTWGANKLMVDGWFHGGRQGALDLTVEGANLQIDQMLALAQEMMPNAASREALRAWKGKGKLNLNGNIAGPFTQGKKPQIRVDAALVKGSFEHPGYGLNIDHVGGQTHYDNAGQGTLSVADFVARQNGDLMALDGSLRSFKDPELDLTANGMLAFGLLGPLLPSNWDRLSGKLHLDDVRIQGRLRDLAEPRQTASASGLVALEGVSWRCQEQTWTLPSGTCALAGENLTLSGVQIRGPATEAVLDATIRGALPSFFLPAGSAAAPFLNATLDAVSVDLEALLAMLRAGSTTKSGLEQAGKVATSVTPIGEPRTLQLPRISGTWQLNVGTLRHRDLSLQSVVAKGTFSPGYWRGENLLLTGMDGKVSGNVSLRNRPGGGLWLEGDAALQDLEVSEVFRQFRDFGQTELTQHHLRGRVSGRVSRLRAAWDTKGRFVEQELVIQADYEVLDGALLDYEPVLALSRFVRVEELEHIRFSSLQSSLRLEDRSIRLPVMEVRSNALDLSLTGTHSFSNVVDYQVKLSLFALLGSRFNKAHAGEASFSESSKSGGLNLFLSMQGPANNPALYYNQREAKQAFRDQDDGVFGRGPKAGENGTEWDGEEPVFIEWEDDKP